MNRKLLLVLLVPVVLACGAWPPRSAAGEFDRQRAVEFVHLCRNTPDRQPNLLLIYWKLKVCEAAGEAFDVNPYAEYAAGLQNADGGFGTWPRDASTAEGTLAALTVLRAAGAGPKDKSACAANLQKCLDGQLGAAARYIDLVIIREMHACLMAMSMVDARPPRLDEALGYLERDGRPWGWYYRVTAGKAFNQPVNDPAAWIRKLDDLASVEYLRRIWRTEDRHCAIETMHLLGGTFTYGGWIGLASYEPTSTPRGPNRLGQLEDAWRNVRMARLLKQETPWLAQWLKDSASIEPSVVPGFAGMPGMETDPSITLRAARIVGEQAMKDEMSQPAAAWLEKQKPDGYFEEEETKVSRWFTEVEQLQSRIDSTWKALTVLHLAGVEPKDRAPVIAWLNGIADKRRQDLTSHDILRVLECFELLGGQPAGGAGLAEHFRARFSNDAPAVVRLCMLLKIKPDLPGADARLINMLERVRQFDLAQPFDLPMEVGVLAEMVEAVDGLGASYPHADYIAALLGRMQRADGGFAKPGSDHSNLYDTLAAIRMSEALRRLMKNEE